MKIEHKLSPAVAQFTQESIRTLNELRAQYLAALGTAKEIEMRMELIRASIGQQLQIVQETDGLPRPVSPYQLTADGLKIIGEVPDVMPGAPVEALPPAGVNAVNGADPNV